MGKEFIGIEIGGTKLQIVRGNSQVTILHRERAHIDATAGATGIRNQIEKILPSFLTPTVEAIAVGFGGPVDIRTGRIACSHQIPGWSDFPMQSWLEQLTGRRTVIENDANTAALAEALLGAGKGKNPVFYVTLGSGVGGGLVVDGRIYHGAPPGETEIGHLRLNWEGLVVEQCCSGWAVDRKIRQAIQNHPESRIARLVTMQSPFRQGGEARFLGECLAVQDPVAQAILDETARQLAFALSHVTHLLHPETIVLGGGLSLIGEPLRAAVAQSLPHWLMEVFHPGPSIQLAQLKEDMVPQGALLLAAQPQ